MATNMTTKGQVLIPKHVREAAGLKPGGAVEVSLNAAGEAVVRPVAALTAAESRLLDIRARIDSVVGLFDDNESTDAFMTRISDPLP